MKKIKLSHIKQLLSYIKNINYVRFNNGLIIGSKDNNCFEYVIISNGNINYLLIDYEENLSNYE